MAAEKVPAFQFYPKDFLTDERVTLMSYTEMGIYISLLCRCWLEQSLPADVGELAKMLKIPAARMEKVWRGPVGQCFQVDGSRLRHKRLDAEREKQDTYRRRQSDNGKLGGRPQKPEKPTAFSGLSHIEAKKSSPSPISNLQREILSESLSSEQASELARRAGRLREELYPQWYAKHRHGAKLRLVANGLEFQEAMSLVSTWDDARLEKLAQIVLTTNDDYISRTDRGFKIFALKASWADDRLRQEENRTA